MRILFLVPLLALFAVPLAPHSLERLASHSSRSPSLPTIQDKLVDNTEEEIEEAPSRVTTSPTTPSNEPAPVRESSQAAAAASASPPPAHAEHVTIIETFVEASPPSPSATAERASSAFSSAIEEEVLRLTNIERAGAGLAPLAANMRLRDIAWGHSADMMANGYFSHDDEDGCSSSCRATEAGYRWRTIGENIYMMSGYSLEAPESAAMVVKGWMNSPGHRANILKDAFTESGVGVVSDGESIYVTALYAKPR